MFAHHVGVKRQRGWGYRRQPRRLRREKKTREVAAAIDRAVDAERLVGMNDGDMRRAEEIEIFQCLFGVARLVAPDDAERIIKLKAAFATPLQIDAAIFARERKIPGVRLAARGGAVDHVTELFGRSTRSDRELPRLA